MRISHSAESRQPESRRGRCLRLRGRRPGSGDAVPFPLPAPCSSRQKAWKRRRRAVPDLGQDAWAPCRCRRLRADSRKAAEAVAFGFKAGSKEAETPCRLRAEGREAVEAVAFGFKASGKNAETPPAPCSSSLPASSSWRRCLRLQGRKRGSVDAVPSSSRRLGSRRGRCLRLQGRKPGSFRAVPAP